MKTLANAEDKEEVLRRLGTLTPDLKALWGRMSVHQMLCHLSDSYLATMGEKDVSDATGMLQRTIIKRLALTWPMPWPHGLPTRPEIEQGCGGTPPVNFESDRKRVIELTAIFSRPERDFKRHRHPTFGHMSQKDWLRWGYLHADHHLRQFGV